MLSQKDCRVGEWEETEWGWRLGRCRAEMRSVEVPAGLDFVLTTLCAGAWPVILTWGMSRTGTSRHPLGRLSTSAVPGTAGSCDTPQTGSRAALLPRAQHQGVCSSFAADLFLSAQMCSQPVLQTRRSMYKGTPRFDRSTLYVSGKRRNSLGKEQLLKFDQTGS